MDLIVQAPAIDRSALDAIAALTRAASVCAFDGGGQQACRLTRVQERSGCVEICIAAGLDHAFVTRSMRRSRVRVVAVDMDSTLIANECIDELAALIGIGPQVAALTASTMRGDLDFRASFEQRVALLAGLPLAALERVYADRLRLSPGVERMVAGFQAAGAKIALVSGGFTFFTDRLAERLSLDDAVGTVLGIEGGRLTGKIRGPIVDGPAKAARLRSLREQYAGNGGLVVAVGDGANDLPMLASADVSVAYRAKAVVRRAANYALDHSGLDGVLNLFA